MYFARIMSKNRPTNDNLFSLPIHIITTLSGFQFNTWYEMNTNCQLIQMYLKLNQSKAAKQWKKWTPSTLVLQDD